MTNNDERLFLAGNTEVHVFCRQRGQVALCVPCVFAVKLTAGRVKELKSSQRKARNMQNFAERYGNACSVYSAKFRVFCVNKQITYDQKHKTCQSCAMPFEYNLKGAGRKPTVQNRLRIAVTAVRTVSLRMTSRLPKKCRTLVSRNWPK